MARVTLTLWNQWVRPRFERTADGTASLYFGVGRLSWRRTVRPYPQNTDRPWC